MDTTSSTPTHQPWKPSAPYLTMGAQVCMFIAIATVNVLTLVVMALTPKLQTIPNLYIAALASSDLVVSLNQLLAIPWTYPETHGYFENNYSLCMFFKCLLHINELASIFTIAVIGMDRYLYIQHPFWYLRVVTKKKVKVMVVVVWLVSGLVALPIRFSSCSSRYPGCSPYALLYDSAMAGYFNGVLFFLICSVLFVSYGIVIRAAVKQAGAIRAMHCPRITSTFVSALASPESTPECVRAENLEASVSLKIVKKMAGVFLMLFLCWTPYILIGLMGPQTVDPQFVVLSGFLAAFNSAANFGVYALGDREFRAATLRILCCKKSTTTTRITSLTNVTQSDQGARISSSSKTDSGVNMVVINTRHQSHTQQHDTQCKDTLKNDTHHQNNTHSKHHSDTDLTNNKHENDAHHNGIEKTAGDTERNIAFQNDSLPYSI